MRPEDVPAELVEVAARAIHEAECCPLDQDSQCYGWPLGQETERARHALAAVLPLAQAAALEEAADEMYGDKRASGPFAHPLSVMTWLRERAARLREGGPFASGPFEQESPQDAAQAPQDGANGGDVGSGRGEGENGAPECPCAACDPGISLTGANPIWFPSRMNVCPDCGNKRCPKAADHALWQCNDSNEVWQVARPVSTPQTGAQAPGEGEA